ncbi:uncharacterized protein [Melanerpes formicivorus]|uniref:uncharacterized protein isoform X2 n=1 Tax=Melanerpes formicivorus TaxID=211600 RepID=UPI00358FD638
MGRDRLLRPPNNLTCRAARDGTSPTSLGSLGQALSTLSVKHFCLLSSLNLPLGVQTITPCPCHYRPSVLDSGGTKLLPGHAKFLCLPCHPGLLVPLAQAAEVGEPLKRKVTAVGSSVLLPGPEDTSHIHSLQWEHLNSTNSSSTTILQYSRRSPSTAIHPPYTGRALFHPSNGSLWLEGVQESDSGIYKVTVNRRAKESQEVLLEVLKPVAHPRLRSSPLVAQAAGQVLCEVAEGKVDTITWKKDGQLLPPDRALHLSSRLSVLYLRSAKKSDCGCYSCNASNGISWAEASLNITVAGVSPPLQDVLRIAVVAVVFAAVSLWGLIFPVCQSEKLRIRGELWRWLSAYTCGLVCVGSILASIAGVLWMWEEGPSIAIILPEIALAYIIVITFLVSTGVIFQPAMFSQIKNKSEEGCTPLVGLSTLVVSTAAVAAVPLLAIFFSYHTTQRQLHGCDSSWVDKERSFEMAQPTSKEAVSSSSSSS